MHFLHPLGVSILTFFCSRLLSSLRGLSACLKRRQIQGAPPIRHSPLLIRGTTRPCPHKYPSHRPGLPEARIPCNLNRPCGQQQLLHPRTHPLPLHQVPSQSVLVSRACQCPLSHRLGRRCRCPATLASRPIHSNHHSNHPSNHHSSHPVRLAPHTRTILLKVIPSSQDIRVRGIPSLRRNRSLKRKGIHKHLEATPVILRHNLNKGILSHNKGILSSPNPAIPSSHSLDIPSSLSLDFLSLSPDILNLSLDIPSKVLLLSRRPTKATHNPAIHSPSKVSNSPIPPSPLLLKDTSRAIRRSRRPRILPATNELAPTDALRLSQIPKLSLSG
eukprot:m.170472 g.170472  ORF g.170472 m.170472 type:complete len:331 (+) comp53254_c0_seq2:1274-2266(+)